MPKLDIPSFVYGIDRQTREKYERTRTKYDDVSSI